MNPDDLVEDTEVEQLEPEAAPAEPEDEEFDVEIEGEAPEAEADEEPPEEDEAEIAEAPKWVKETRAKNREMAKRIKELEAEKAKAPVIEPPKAPVLGPKPTLAECDFDEAKFETELEAWKDAKAGHDRGVAEAKAAEDAKLAAWQQRVKAFDDKGAKYPGFAGAKASVMKVMSTDQQAMVLDATLDPSAVVALLGKFPAKAKALAEIKNPVQFIAEIARLETKMTVTKRAPQTAPEKVIVGSTRSAASATANLEKLHKQAQETGNYDAYFAAKRAASKK